MTIEKVAEQFSMSETELKTCLNETLLFIMKAQATLARVPLGRSSPGLQSTYNHLLDAGRVLEARMRGAGFGDSK
jgi:hypothetical protein